MTKRDIALGFALGASRRAPETHNHVTINQQPHDAADAARLLGELEHKAEDRIRDGIRVANTEFECVVHCWHEAASDKTVFRAVFKLNGRQMEATHTANREIGLSTSQMMWKNASALRDEIAKEIATQVIGPAFEAMMRSAARG